MHIEEESFFRSVMFLYEGAKTCVEVDSALSDVFGVKLRTHQVFVLSPFLAVVVDVVAELAGESVLTELLCADDLVLMSD